MRRLCLHVCKKKHREQFVIPFIFIERFFPTAANNVRVVIVNLAALLFLFFVIFPQCFHEKLVVGIFNILLLIDDVAGDACIIHIRGDELPVVMLNIRTVRGISLAKRKADAQTFHRYSFLFLGMRNPP